MGRAMCLALALGWASHAMALEAGVLPIPTISAESGQAVRGHLMVLEDDGAPITGLKLRGSANRGTVLQVEEVGQGLYTFEYVAPRTDASFEAVLTFKGRASSGPVEVTGRVGVNAGSVHTLKVALNPPKMVLGRDKSATIAIQIDGDSPPETVTIHSTTGKVEHITPMGNGRFTARYVPKSVNYPHLAVLTVADPSDPSNVVEVLPVPLFGSVSFPVSGPAGATALIRIGDREFGPVMLDASGKGTVPIEVPPGLEEATLVLVENGRSEESPLALGVPETSRMSLLPMPASVVANPVNEVPLRVAAFTQDGAVDPTASVEITATAGRVGPVKHVGNGVFEAVWTPPAARSQLVATIQASIAGSKAAGMARDVSLVPPAAAGVELRAEPTELAEAATSLRLFAKVVDEDGRGLARQGLAMQAGGADSDGTWTDLGGGDYKIDLNAEKGPVVATIAPRGVASANTVHHVLAYPEREVLDGGGRTLVTFVAVDQFGAPVPNAEVELSSTVSGALPGTVQTDAFGLAWAWFTAPSATGVASIRASSGAAQGAAAVWVGPAPTGLDLPDAGTETRRELAAAWGRRIATVRVPRAGLDTMAVADVTAVGAAGVASTLDLAIDPGTVAPGGRVLVKVTARDGAGATVAGGAFDFFTTSGSFGDVTDNGNGTYHAQLSVPADAAGMVKVSVIGSGVTPAVLEIPVADVGGAAVATSWGEVPEEETPAEEVAATEPPPEEPPPSFVDKSSDEPVSKWMRLRASFMAGSHTYAQSPAAESGRLFTRGLSWGGDSGGRASAPLGMEADLHMYVPQVKYLGFVANFRMGSYSVEGDGFEEPIKDTLFSVRAEVAGRIPFRVKQAELYTSLRVGLRYEDMIVFTGCTDPGCTWGYEPLALTGLGGGLEFGFDWNKLYGNAAVVGALAYGSVPTTLGVDANLGYQILDNFFVNGGFAWQTRSVNVEGADSGATLGEVKDQTFYGTIGVGFSL